MLAPLMGWFSAELGGRGGRLSRALSLPGLLSLGLTGSQPRPAWFLLEESDMCESLSQPRDLWGSGGESRRR